MEALSKCTGGSNPKENPMVAKYCLACILSIFLIFLFIAYVASDNAGVNNGTNTPDYPKAPHSEKYNVAVQTLAELNKIKIQCPAFLDAPVGFKPCPAQQQLDIDKAAVQAVIDNTY
jgi:hypothetical protein